MFDLSNWLSIILLINRMIKIINAFRLVRRVIRKDESVVQEIENNILKLADLLEHDDKEH